MKRSLAVVFGLAATLDVGGAYAQSPQPLDIVGVQLGMPRESAVRLLQSRQPPYSVTNEGALTVEDLGPSVWHTSLDANTPSVVDTFELDFAPPPTESTVLRIHRGVCYNCGGGKTSPDAPSVENFVHSIAAKLKSGTPTAVVRRSQNAGIPSFEGSVYVWTPAGEFLSSAQLGRRLRYPARCISPPTLDQARTNMGVSFDLHLDDKNFGETCGIVAEIDWQQEGGVITHFDMTFSDVGALLSAFSKSRAFLEAKKSSQHQKELEHANQNVPKL